MSTESTPSTLDTKRGDTLKDFRPTASELEQLAYYWYREWWNLTLSEIHFMGYSEPHARFDDASCMNALEDIIGEEAMQIMFEEEIGDEDWAAITRTYNAAWRRFFERVKLEYEHAILRMERDRREASVRDSRDDKGPEGESQPSE